MAGKCNLLLLCVLVEFLLGMEMKMWDDLKSVVGGGVGGVWGGGDLFSFLALLLFYY